MSYDKNNIFAKILRKEIPCKKVYENDHVLAFQEIVELNKAITYVSNLIGAKDKGYRALTNIGSDGGQEVPHLHFHIFAGEKIGKMVS